MPPFYDIIIKGIKNTILLLDYSRLGILSMEINISSKLKAIRKEKNISQQKLAFKAGLTISVITKIEQGLTPNPSILTVAKIANVLSVSIDNLIGRKIQ